MTREGIELVMQQEYARRRAENLAEHERRVNEACAACPGLRRAIDARSEALMNGIRGTLLSSDKRPDKASGLSRELENSNRKIAALLKASGLPENALAPVYDCEECRDEGYLYLPERRMCGCFEKELRLRALRDMGMSADGAETFENFREDIFTKNDKPVAQLSQIRSIKTVCERFADDYPGTATRDLLLVGESGLGKTFMMKAIAARVIRRGYDAAYVSAYRMFETARQAYFENNSAIMKPLMDAPLLLLDDLGTEPLMANITISQLFNLLNERQNAGRHTVISTNLVIPELQERYTERITSRFLDKRSCAVLKFIGSDVRPRLAGGDASK